MRDFPLTEGWVEARLPSLTRPVRRLLDALEAGEDLKGGEATPAIAPETIYTIAQAISTIHFQSEALVHLKRDGMATIAEGPAAVEAYVRQIIQHGDHAHWPGTTLVFRSARSNSRLAVTSDPDGSVIRLFSWGSESDTVLEQVLERLWQRMQSSEMG